MVVATGMFLFSTVDLGTSTTVTAVYMVVLGAGMGAIMQTSTLIAQNSLQPQDMGAGTAASTFLRNIGSSLGVSILGAIYAHQLTGSLSGATGATTGSTGGASMTPQLLRTLPPAVQHLFGQAVTSGITSLFLWGSVVAAAGIVVALFVKHVPLRGSKPAEPSVDRSAVAEELVRAEELVAA
jgi:hypothetical protein